MKRYEQTLKLFSPCSSYAYNFAETFVRTRSSKKTRFVEENLAEAKAKFQYNPSSNEKIILATL